MERLCVRMNRVKKRAVSKQRLAAAAAPQPAWSLYVECDPVSGFQIDLCDPASPPPYSPDLAPADSILFPKLKLFLKGERFSDINDIQCAVTELLKWVSLQDFSALSTTSINHLR